jgi:hypothetical protein
MGRPRLYANDAERQAEHRARRQRTLDTQKAAHRSLFDRVTRLHEAVTANAPDLAGDVPTETLEAVIRYFNSPH